MPGAHLDGHCVDERTKAGDGNTTQKVDRGADGGGEADASKEAEPDEGSEKTDEGVVAERNRSADSLPPGAAKE